MKRFIFVTRTWDFIQKNDKEELKFPDLKELQEQWGPNYQVLTLDDKGLFNLTAGDQLYVMGGHGKPASDVVFWGKEDNTENHLTAKTVAEYTVERFPTCYRAQTGTAEKAFWESKVIKLDKDKLPHKDYKIKPTSKNPTPGVLIKVYSCHSAEGGFNSP